MPLPDFLVSKPYLCPCIFDRLLFFVQKCVHLVAVVRVDELRMRGVDFLLDFPSHLYM